MGGRAGGRGWGGASPGGLGGEPDCRAGGGRRGGGEAAGQGDSPWPPPRALRCRAPAPPPPARFQPTRSRLICITRRATPTPRPALAVRMVSTPPRRGGKEKAPKWRGRGAGREGRRELGVGRQGRKDGEGRIDSNPNNNKAIKGRRRPALRLSISWRFLGQGLELEHNKLRRGDGRRCVRRGDGAAVAPGCEGLCGEGGGECRRGWSFCVTQTRDLQVGLGGFHEALWARLGFSGFVCWGRVGGEGSARCESRRFHRGSGGVTGLE